MRSARRYQPVKRIQAAKFGYFAISGLLCILGLIMMIFPQLSAMTFCYAAGGILLIYGIIKIIGYFSKDLYRLAFQYDLAFGLLMMILGGVMLLHPGTILAFINIIIGLVILSDGLFKIQIALDAKKFGVSKWWLIMALAVVTALASLVLIIYPRKGAEFLMIWMGISLLVEGILSFAVAFYGVKIIRNQHLESPDVIEM